MQRGWKAIVEINWDASNIEEFNVSATTEFKARKKLIEEIKKKHPDIGKRYSVVQLIHI